MSLFLSHKASIIDCLNCLNCFFNCLVPQLMQCNVTVSISQGFQNWLLELFGPTHNALHCNLQWIQIVSQSKIKSRFFEANCGNLLLFLSHRASIMDCWLLWLNCFHPQWTQLKKKSAHARFCEEKLWQAVWVNFKFV